MSSAGSDRPPRDALTPEAENAAGSSRSVWVSAVVDVGVPVAAYYVLRAVGLSPVVSLLLGGVAPAARGVYLIVRHRRVDALAGLTLSVVLLSAATSALTGDARFALARDAVVTLAVGIWILITLRMRRPFIFSFSTAFMAAAERQSWNDCWARSAKFRHGMAVHTGIWGSGMIIDAAVRIVIAYTLPVDAVPAVNAVQYAVLIVGLMIISVIYSRSAGLVPGSPDYPAKPTKTAGGTNRDTPRTIVT